MNSKKEQKKTKRNYFLYDFVKITGAIPCFFWLRVKTIRFSSNSPKRVKGAAVIAANHTSFLDPIIVHLAFWYRRLHCLATKDLFSTKLKRWFFTTTNCIEVDKENFSIASLHTVCDVLRDGKAVMIFPEGHVNRDVEDLHTYKSGAVLMAHIGRAPIIPVYIAKGKRWYNRTSVVIGEPVNVCEMCGRIPSMEDIDKVSLYLHEKEEELKAFYETKFDKTIKGETSNV